MAPQRCHSLTPRTVCPCGCGLCGCDSKYGDCPGLPQRAQAHPTSPSRHSLSGRTAEGTGLCPTDPRSEAREPPSAVNAITSDPGCPRTGPGLSWENTRGERLGFTTRLLKPPGTRLFVNTCPTPVRPSSGTREAVLWERGPATAGPDRLLRLRVHVPAPHADAPCAINTRDASSR